MLTTPKTLTEAIRHYSDAQTCINAVAMLRWEDGSPVCPRCNAAQGERNHYWLAKQKRWKCYSCRKQFSVKGGNDIRGFPAWSGCVANSSVDALQLPQWGLQL